MSFTDTGGSSSDEISLFLRQLIHRSSSSSPTPIIPQSTFPSVSPHAGNQHQHQHLPSFSSLPISTAPNLHHQIPSTSTFFSGSRSSDHELDRILLPAPSVAVSRASNFSSESGPAPVRSLEKEYGDDYECQSEEAGAEEEADLRMPLSRNQSKRSRAAEVHNLSEKKRRSKINEKMKALQTLIPNSNKTDKASMLDEAIEYLKQLQLQVQTLSMRNGLSLHPMCVPDVSGILNPATLSHIGLDFSDTGTGSRSLDANMPNELNILPTVKPCDAFVPAEQCPPSMRPSLPSVPYSLDSCTHDNFGPFQLLNYPQAVHRERNVLSEQLVPSNAQSKLPSEIGVVTTTALPFDSRNMDANGHNILEAQSHKKYGLQEMLP